MEAAYEPETLQEAVVYFNDPVNCREYLVARRWPNGVICPRCGSQQVAFLSNYDRWQCAAKHAARQFTAKTGTVMEDSPISLDKWLMAMWLVGNCKNGVSSYEIHRALGITQKTAWFMDHRIRLAMGLEPAGKMSGHVEADETFIGGKARNMHASKRARKITGTGGKDKTAVMGILERSKVRKHVEAGSALYTDALQSYNGLDEFEHQVVDHAVQYVDGKIHTNGMENFWSLLKRGLRGTYVSVEPFHLFRYLDEQMFRFNERKLTDSERFSLIVTGVVGKRVTYKELTGKEACPPCAN